MTFGPDYGRYRTRAEHMREYDEQEDRLVELRAEHESPRTKAEFAGRFKAAVLGRDRKCFWRELGGCDGPLEADHLIDKRRIRDNLRGKLGDGPELWAVMYDPRSAVACCQAHHHLRTVRALSPERWRIPAHVEEFAAEHRFTWSLDRDYGDGYLFAGGGGDA